METVALRTAPPARRSPPFRTPRRDESAGETMTEAAPRSTVFTYFDRWGFTQGAGELVAAVTTPSELKAGAIVAIFSSVVSPRTH